MSLIGFGGGEVGLADEWYNYGAQASRVTSVKRTGNGALQSDLTVASGNGTFWGEGGKIWSQTPTGRIYWLCAPFYFDVLPTGAPAYGPMYNGGGGGVPYAFRVTTVSGTYKLQLVDLGLNALASGSQTISAGTWYPLLMEWDFPSLKVTWWLWSGSAWSQDGTYTASEMPTTFWPCWGWQSFKAGSIGSKPVTDDVYWMDDADSGDGCKTKPAEPPAIYYIGPASGTPTYTGWGGSYADVDDYPDSDGDTTYDESGTGTSEVKQSYQMTDSVVGSDNILGVGEVFTYKNQNAGTQGQMSHLLRADSADVMANVYEADSSVYNPSGVFWAETPAGNPWTEALLNGAEAGARRGSGSASMRNMRLTMICLMAAKGTLEAPVVRRVAPIKSVRCDKPIRHLGV